MKPAAKPNRLAIEYVSVDSLIPYVNNARTHSPEQVAQISASIKEFGFTNPVLIDGENGLIAGHGRVMAARKLGMKDVPCIQLAHLSAAQKRAYILADNQLALNAGWDDDMLALELSQLDDLGFDLAMTGFSEDEISRLVIDSNETSMPELASGDRAPLQEMTFLLHDAQAETVRSALSLSKSIGAFVDTGNENGNGNSLARICELFIGHHGHG